MEGVIAREREINWSEVHFHSAFKTCRHATQFGPSVGFLCMCLYLRIWVWTKAQLCGCMCARLVTPRGRADDLHRSSWDLQTHFYTVILVLVIETLCIQCIPSHCRLHVLCLPASHSSPIMFPQHIMFYHIFPYLSVWSKHKRGTLISVRSQCCCCFFSHYPYRITSCSVKS